MAKIEQIKNKKHEVIHPVTTKEAVEGLADALTEKQDTLVPGSNIKNINGESIVGSGTLYVTPSSGTFTVDSELSEESDNAVENKTITQALSTKQEVLISGENIKTVGGESILGSGNIIVGDDNAIKFVPQELDSGQQEQARDNIGAGTLRYNNELAEPEITESNTIQIEDVEGNPLFPVTEASLVRGLQEGGFSKYIMCWDGTNTPVASSIPEDVIVSYLGVEYVGTLIADDSTANMVYLVYSTVQPGEYNRYITIFENGEYSWKPLSSTQIVSPTIADDLETNNASMALSARQGVVIKGKLDQLGQQVNYLSGKYYGVFESATSLPADADEDGHAFIGALAPFEVWQFSTSTGEWTNTGATVEGISGEDGEDGVGFSAINTPEVVDGTVILTLSDGNTITLDLNHDHPDYIPKSAGSEIPEDGFAPDIPYKLGVLTGAITFKLAPEVQGNTNHYFWTFTAGQTAPTITWPTGMEWFDGTGPTIVNYGYYEISVLDGVAAYLQK